jgi:hypothetical protein
MEIKIGGIAEVSLMIWRYILYLGPEEKWSVKNDSQIADFQNRITWNGLSCDKVSFKV